jgi:hypothetical protein
MEMPTPTKAELINDPEVRKEIDRYKWVESEKHGFDIGFERAADEWYASCSEAWLKSRTAVVSKPCVVAGNKSCAVTEKKPLRKGKKI